jgi:hypothetical protein
MANVLAQRKGSSPAAYANHWPPVAQIILGQRSDLSDDEAHLQLVFVFQNGFRKRNRKPSEKQDVQTEVHFPGWEDHPNG